MHLISVNIGKARPTDVSSIGFTGIYKTGTDGPVFIGSEGALGDAVCDESCHGGPDQAIYVYSQPDYDWWAEQIGQTLAPGAFGENFTVTDLKSQEVCVGDRLDFGSVILEVTSPRIPCGTLAAKMEDPQFVKKFKDAARPGFYCRVIKTGSVEAGSSFTYHAADDGLPVSELFADYYDRDADRTTLERFLSAPIAVRTREKLRDRLAELA